VRQRQDHDRRFFKKKTPDLKRFQVRGLGSEVLSGRLIVAGSAFDHTRLILGPFKRAVTVERRAAVAATAQNLRKLAKLIPMPNFQPA
jgi:hypothetical protein